MRLGGTILMSYSSPQEWIEIVRKLRYSAVLAPVDHDAPDDLVKDYLKEAKKADVIIAEVGAWSNPISPDDKVRKAALEYCRSGWIWPNGLEQDAVLIQQGPGRNMGWCLP